MLRIEYWAAIRWFWSTSTFATFTLPWYCFATSSTTGATMRHGPHHSAQKSTRTGTCDWSTSESNVLSLTWITESAMGKDSLHDELDRTDDANALVTRVLAGPQSRRRKLNDLDAPHQGRILTSNMLRGLSESPGSALTPRAQGPRLIA